MMRRPCGCSARDICSSLTPWRRRSNTSRDSRSCASAASLPSHRFVQDLYPRHRRVVDHGLERQVDLPLCRGLDVRKTPGDDSQAARFLVDVEAPQQRLSIAEHVKDSPADAAFAWQLWSIVELGEVQDHGITSPSIYRDGITEVSESFRAEKLGIFRATHLATLGGTKAVLIVIVGTPALALVVDE